MSTSAHLDTNSLSLEPGGEAVIPLQIRNTGDIVEAYRLEVVGIPGQWTSVEPRDISLYPGTTTTATVALHPPRSASVPAGELPFGIRVVPSQHPEETITPEGVVQILPFLETAAEVTPRTTHGRRRGRHQVAVDNRGNVAVAALLSVPDSGDRLQVAARPEALTVGPGEAAFASVVARPTKRIWRGAPVTHPFQVTVIPQDSAPVTLDATYLQEPILPPWIMKALAALLALLLALAAVWFLLFKPAAESAARAAVKKSSDQAAKQATQAQVAAEDAQKAATDSKKSAGDAKVFVSQTQKVVAKPFSTRLSTTPSPGGNPGRDAYSVPDKRTLQLTDLVLQNPQGDFGRVKILSGDKVLFELALENFRDIDYHFVTPIEVKSGKAVTLEVRCDVPGTPVEGGPPPDTCSTATYLGGTLETITKPKAKT